MIPLLIRILSFILVMYVLYLLLKRRPFYRRRDSLRHEKTKYDKDEWKKIQQSLEEDFSDDDNQET